MFQFTVNCTGALRASNQMYSELQDKFVDLQDVAEDEKARADNEEKLKKDALEKAAQEENKKKNWRTKSSNKSSNEPNTSKMPAVS